MSVSKFVVGVPFTGIDCVGHARHRCDNPEDIRCNNIIEFDPKLLNFLRARFGKHVKVKDIMKLKPSDFEDSDIVFGSPPCQPFNRQGKMLGCKDPRSKPFIKLVEMRTRQACWKCVVKTRLPS